MLFLDPPPEQPLDFDLQYNTKIEDHTELRPLNLDLSISRLHVLGSYPQVMLDKLDIPTGN